MLFRVNSTADLVDTNLTDDDAWTGNFLPNGEKEVTLRAAIMQINNMSVAGPYTINFAPLTAGGVANSVILQSPMYDIRVPVVIDGISKNLLTITRDTTAAAGFHYFTVARTPGAPATIQVEFKNMTIRDADGRGVDVDRGGAIANSANLTLTNVNLYDNRANSGGALFNDTTGVLTLNNCVLVGNRTRAESPAIEGGAVFATG